MFKILVAVIVLSNGHIEMMTSRASWPTEQECKDAIPGDRAQIEAWLKENGIEATIEMACFNPDERPT